MIMEDDTVIGIRRAAQRVAGAAGGLKGGEEDVVEGLKRIVDELA